MPFSNYLLTALCQLVYGNNAFIPPATIYVGLSTSQPNPDGTNVTEPNINGYARVAVINDSTHWHLAPGQPATGERQSNAQQLVFPVALGDWGTVTWVVLYDALSGGNFLGYGQLLTPENITTGQAYVFQIDQLTTTMQ